MMQLESRPTSSAIETPVPGELRKVWRAGRGGFYLARTETQSSIFTADFVTRAAKNRGQLTHSSWSGRRQRESAAPVFCMCCKNTTSTSTNGSREFWPEFAQAGKEEITFAQLLSHQAGLCALDRRVDVLDYGAVIQALEAQKPLWPPGTAHGYHARTFGFLLDELVRRIARKTLSDYWQEVFARPLNLDLWIGLPEKRESSRGNDLRGKKRQAAGPESNSTSILSHRAL